MSNLLREYIQQILSEATIKNVNIIPGQILSAISEYAVVEGLGGAASFDESLGDKLVAPYFTDLEELGVNQKKINSKYIPLMQEIYNDCVRVTQASISDLGIKEIVNVSPGNVGTTTAKVDVILTGKLGGKLINADVHVKFNDFARLIGLQADAEVKEGEVAGKVVLNAKKLVEELDKEWPAAAQYKYLRNKFIVLPEEEGGLGFVPKRSQEKVSAIRQYGPKRELQILQDPDLRERFLDYLRANDLPRLILNEVKSFFASTGKAVYFYKFRTKPKAININSYDAGQGPLVELVVDKIVANSKKLKIRENLEKTYGSTCLYIFSYDDRDVFFVEARTSKEGHPMQIKVVKGADLEKIFVESEYEIVVS